MIAEISAAWAATTSASKAITGILSTVQNVETKKAIAAVQDTLIDVQGKLLAVQTQYEALADAKRDIEQKLAEYARWEFEAARYKLEQIVPGIFVYSLKPDDATGEPPHWLCPNCFQEQKKSILSKPNIDHMNYKCHRCPFDIIPTSYEYPKGDDLTGSYLPDY